MMSRRPDVRPTLEGLITQLDVISRRMRGRVPPRHVQVTAIQPEAAAAPAPALGLPAPVTGGAGGALPLAAAPVQTTMPLSIGQAAAMGGGLPGASVPTVAVGPRRGLSTPVLVTVLVVGILVGVSLTLMFVFSMLGGQS
jgi:hypothetical protein